MRQGKTKNTVQLLKELVSLRRRIAELGKTQRKLKKAENENHRSGMQLKDILDNMSVGVYQTTPDGRILMANPALVQMLGYSSFEEIKKLNVEEKGFAPGYHRSTFKELIEKKGRIRNFESAWLKRDGTTLYTSENARAVRDQSGKTLYYEGTVQDFTKFKKAEEDIKALGHQIEFILGATKTGLDIIDSQFNIRFIDPEWQKVYGDPTGKKCYKYFMGRNKVCPDCGIVKALQTKTVTVSEEVLVRENNRPIQVITIPFQNEKGEWLVAEVNVDITERKKAEELLRATFNATTESVSLIDKDLNILLVNQTCAQRFGRTVEQIEGQNARNSVNYVGSAEVLNYRIEQINKVFHSGKPVRFEDERAGIFFDTNIYPVFDEKGEVSCAAIFGKDITEQKKSERSMRALFDATTESVFLLDKHLKVLALNKIAAQRFGKNPEQLVGTHIQDFLPNSASRDVVGRRIKQLNNVIRSGKPARIEDERMGMVFDTSIYPVFDAGGKVSSVAVFSKDITEEKKSKAALAESQLRYQTLFDNAPVGIGVADKESRPLAFNEAMLKMTGYSDAEMRQIRIKDTYVNPQQRQKLMKRLRRDGFVRDYEVQLKRKDGTVYDASLAIIPFILSGKKVFLTVQRDITKRKQAEEALRHSESKYKTLLENLPQRIFLKDKNSVYVSCNENYACDLKIKSEEIAGKTDYDFYPKKLAEKYRADDKKLIASGKTEDIEEKYIREGQETIVHTVKTPVKDKEGNITGILGIFWDITEQKKAEQELDAYREKMIQGEQMSSLGALGATLFHELTQPLTVANLSIENVLAKPQTKSIPEAIEKKLRDCLSGISDATSIVKRFRDYVRGLSKTTATDISLSAIAERVVNLLRGAAIRSKVRISVKHLEKLPSLNLRERDIELLFFVLIDNAIQAANGKKEHRLTISGAVKNEQVELQFSDNCSGIAPENLDKIFDPFFTTKPPSKGTGMGLCVVKHLVSQIRGNIRVESEVGKGSTFSVTLPVKMSGLL